MPHFDPNQHHRRSIRLKDYDYAQPGAYFITLVATQRACLFGEIDDGEVHLKPVGKLIEDIWKRIPGHFESITLDEFVVMPNHLHGILIIQEGPCTGEASATRPMEFKDYLPADASPQRPKGTKPGSIGAIIQNFKSVSTRRANASFFNQGNRLWQRDYYEHVVRNERELDAIREYILNNPLQWELDRENRLPRGS